MTVTTQLSVLALRSHESEKKPCGLSLHIQWPAGNCRLQKATATPDPASMHSFSKRMMPHATGSCQEPGSPRKAPVMAMFAPFFALCADDYPWTDYRVVLESE